MSHRNTLKRISESVHELIGEIRNPRELVKIQEGVIIIEIKGIEVYSNPLRNLSSRDLIIEELLHLSTKSWFNRRVFGKFISHLSRFHTLS